MVTHRDGVLPGLKVVGSVSPARPAQSSQVLLSPPHSLISPMTERPLTPTQVESIRAAMRVFVEDDLARGVSQTSRIYCDACERARPAAGFIQYDRYSLCNLCAIEYEAARIRGVVGTPGQFVRDKHFGEADYYALSD